MSGLGGVMTSAGAPSAGTGTTMAGTGGAPPKVCGPAWAGGTMYSKGDIVQYQGKYYIAEEDNPGYDPLISTYFWEPYNCSDGGGSAGATGMGGSGNKPPTGESAFDDIVSEQLFNELFPGRDSFYTYQGLVDASKYYPEFAGSGTMDDRKREAAAFLANVSRETGELRYIEQIAKDVYCSDRAACPCEPGKQYFGRGPIQISWNYNYCAAGKALGLEDQLRANPDLVAQDSTIAWETGLWFWMTQSGAGTMTPHNGIMGGSFGQTIRSINGGVECDGKSPEGVTSRQNFYLRFCEILGVDPGQDQTC
jgi:predicted chitinase